MESTPQPHPFRASRSADAFAEWIEAAATLDVSAQVDLGLSPNAVPDVTRNAKLNLLCAIGLALGFRIVRVVDLEQTAA